MAAVEHRYSFMFIALLTNNRGFVMEVAPSDWQKSSRDVTFAEPEMDVTVP